MTEPGPDDAFDRLSGRTGDEHEERSVHVAALKTAWQRTLEDMEAMAAAREDEGWDVVSIMAGDTAPTNPDVGDDRFGLVFVIPNDRAGAFEAAFDRGSFPTYEVYRNTVEGNVFLVVEYRDPAEELSIFVAGQYELRHAGGMARAAKREDEMYTYVQTLDGTVLGSFRHEAYGNFVPDAKTVAAWLDRRRRERVDDVSGDTADDPSG